jgi:hypothetical protein
MPLANRKHILVNISKTTGDNILGITAKSWLGEGAKIFLPYF